MDWNVISAIATVLGTILTFISITIAIGIERQKSKNNHFVVKRNLSNLRHQLPQVQEQKSYLGEDTFGAPEWVSEGKSNHDPYAPYLNILVGLIGACGGAASIMVPWLLLQASPNLQCILYPLLITGIIGGVAFALLMDTGNEMEKATPYLRFPLSAICGVIGGWIGLLVVAGFIVYKAATETPTMGTYGNLASPNHIEESTAEKLRKS